MCVTCPIILKIDVGMGAMKSLGRTLKGDSNVWNWLRLASVAAVLNILPSAPAQLKPVKWESRDLEYSGKLGQ